MDAVAEHCDLVGEVVEARAEDVAQVTVAGDVVGEFASEAVVGLVRSHVEAVDTIQVVAVSNVPGGVVAPVCGTRLDTTVRLIRLVVLTSNNTSLPGPFLIDEGEAKQEIVVQGGGVLELSARAQTRVVIVMTSLR